MPKMLDTPIRRIVPVRAALILSAALLLSLAAARCGQSRPVQGPVAETLRQMLLPPTQAGFSPQQGASPFRSWLTPCFYQRRNFRPAWVSDQGLHSEVQPFLESLSAAEAEGLDPCDYGWDRAEALVFSVERAGRNFRKLPPRLLAELDTVLTDAFFLYAYHLSAGKVNAETGLPEWGWPGADEGLVGLLEYSLSGEALPSVLQGLSPRHEYYLNLRNALRDAREQRAGLGTGAESPGPATSASGRNVLARRRAALEQQIETLRLNMERWRWLPHALGRRYILIDTARFRLFLSDAGRIPLSMKVVVGSPAWQTPVFSTMIKGFTINPSWNCPSTIFYKEIINYIKADKNYLPGNKMVILLGWGASERELDPAAMDWNALNAANYPTFHLRQLPGPANILGRLMFVMPNKFDIYLHDTPYQEDFKQDRRIFSHGCIRAEKPFDLAAYLARSSLWTRDSILAAVDTMEVKTVYFDEPVPIHVNYCTAWPGPDGRVEFRPDIYSLDSKLAAALNARFPALSGGN